ncbi:MazG-like family protein [Salinicoccus sp. YB14-2]|uniref:MazG-like family protein n=1 Tax=Salinicoccus sp. YB14-2 TaxID=1572701 RepID=UPI0009E56ABF|nr:MazG-like family protein [Salinicoccus sp. YB14-2]
MNITELTRKIEVWAIDRNLQNVDSKAQISKLTEEIGELASGVNKSNKEVVKDSIGDAYVVLTILAMQQKVDVRDCIDIAYQEIKDRKGKMVDGVFVKESDLKVRP